MGDQLGGAQSHQGRRGQCEALEFVSVQHIKKLLPLFRFAVGGAHVDPFGSDHR
jgi:hypothetical protein